MIDIVVQSGHRERHAVVWGRRGVSIGHFTPSQRNCLLFEAELEKWKNTHIPVGTNLLEMVMLLACSSSCIVIQNPSIFMSMHSEVLNSFEQILVFLAGIYHGSGDRDCSEG